MGGSGCGKSSFVRGLINKPMVLHFIPTNSDCVGHITTVCLFVQQLLVHGNREDEEEEEELVELLCVRAVTVKGGHIYLLVCLHNVMYMCEDWFDSCGQCGHDH